jgi:triphosphatase
LPVGLTEAELRARFTILVRRTLFTLKPDASTQIDGALDEGEIRTADGKRGEPISEVELLLKSGDPAALYRVGLNLLEVASLRIEIRGKAERGDNLPDGMMDAPQPHHYLPSNLKPRLTVEEICGGSVRIACQRFFSVRRQRSPTYRTASTRCGLLSDAFVRLSRPRGVCCHPSSMSG